MFSFLFRTQHSQPNNLNELARRVSSPNLKVNLCATSRPLRSAQASRRSERRDLVSLLATIAVWNQTFTILVGAWAVPVLTNRAAYASNLRALRDAVLLTEPLFP